MLIGLRGVWTISTTHANFASQLLGDCAADLLRLSGWWDTEMRWAARRNRNLISAAITVENQSALVAAARYAQWISDLIAWDCTRKVQADLTCAARYPRDPDAVALLERQIGPEPVGPGPMPPRPGELVAADTLDEYNRNVIAATAELAEDAVRALARCDSNSTREATAHINALQFWLQGL